MEIAYIAAAMSDRLQNKERHGLLSENRQVQTWKKPRHGEFKINSDGAFDPSSGSGGWGFIIRDDQGMMILAGAGKEEFLLDALHTEVLGGLAGVRAAMQLTMSNIVLEVDAALVKQAVESEDYRLSALGGVITELRSLLISEFVSFRLELCPRSCNKVADAIAVFGCKIPSDDPITWGDVPRFVEGLVTSDLAVSNE